MPPFRTNFQTKDIAIKEKFELLVNAFNALELLLCLFWVVMLSTAIGLIINNFIKRTKSR